MCLLKVLNPGSVYKLIKRFINIFLGPNIFEDRKSSSELMLESLNYKLRGIFNKIHTVIVKCSRSNDLKNEISWLCKKQKINKVDVREIDLSQQN